MAPDVATFATSICDALVTVKLVNGVTPPTAPTTLTAPLPAAIANVCAPLIVLSKVIFELSVVNDTPAPNVTAL